MSSSNIHKRDKNLFTIEDLRDWKPPAREEIIHNGVLGLTERLVIFGEAGSWKTMLTQHAAHCIATGSDFIGFRTSRANVLRLQTELPLVRERKRVLKYHDAVEKSFLERMLKLKPDMTPEELEKLSQDAKAFACPSNMISRSEAYIKLDTSYGLENLKNNIRILNEEWGATIPLLLVVDPIFKVISGKLNDQYETQKLLDNIDLLRDQFNVTVILIHHPRKTQLSDGRAVDFGAEEASGTQGIRSWCDTMLQIKLLNPNPKGTSDRVSLNFVKHRNAEFPLPFIELKWNRETLWPEVVKRFTPKDEVPDEPDLRDLE